MTIIEPNRERGHWWGFIALLVAVVAAGSVVNIWLYTQTVDLRHTISRAEASRQELTVSTAQLKDTLYRQLDGANLSRAAAELGLVLDKKPKYLKITGNQP